MKRKVLIFIILASIATSVLAQDGTSLWSTLGVKKKIGKKLSAEVSLTTRQPENLAYLQTYFGEAGVGFKLNKIFDVAVYYRNIHRKKDVEAVFKKRHRYYVDLNVGKRIGKIKLENRVRYQHQFKDNDIEVTFDASYIRNKVEVSISPLKSLDVYSSFDLFFLLQDKKIDQIRPKIGLNFTINKHNSVDLGLLQNRSLIGELNSGAVIAAAYKFKF
jgi:Protein of unknown function (DUF2490)